MFKRHTVLIPLAAALALACTSLAFAGNGVGPNKSSSSSISLVLMNAATTTTGTSGASYGNQVTFNVSTTVTAYPFVNLKCYQNGSLVGEGWAGFFAGALGSQAFGLYSPQWTGGAADCTATLDVYSNGKWKELASTSFHVNA
jgi:hypothetical protein